MGTEPPPGALGAESVQQGTGPGDDRNDVVDAFRCHVDLEIVDVAAEPSAPVNELVVEEMQRGIEPSTGHWPAFVMIIKGMVANAITTRMTRYTVATAFKTRPFVSSPM